MIKRLVVVIFLIVGYACTVGAAESLKMQQKDLDLLKVEIPKSLWWENFWFDLWPTKYFSRLATQDLKISIAQQKLGSNDYMVFVDDLKTYMIFENIKGNFVQDGMDSGYEYPEADYNGKKDANFHYSYQIISSLGSYQKVLKLKKYDSKTLPVITKMVKDAIAKDAKDSLKRSYPKIAAKELTVFVSKMNPEHGQLYYTVDGTTMYGDISFNPKTFEVYGSNYVELSTMYATKRTILKRIRENGIAIKVILKSLK